MITRDPEFRDRVEHAFATGTCFHCAKPIVNGQARYTITNSHWDCWMEAGGRAVAELQAQLREESRGEDADAPDRWELARANGGYFVHLVNIRTRTAACGHAPKDGAKRMRQRGKWMQPHASVIAATCKRCLAATALPRTSTAGAPSCG